jgi:hypothetical protein
LGAQKKTKNKKQNPVLDVANLMISKNWKKSSKITKFRDF